MKNFFVTADDFIIEDQNPNGTITVSEEYINTYVNDLVETKQLEILNLFLSSISHHRNLLENNESVLIGRALIALHKGDFKLVLFIIYSFCLLIVLDNTRNIFI